jgi:hypothetical protein
MVMTTLMKVRGPHVDNYHGSMVQAKQLAACCGTQRRWCQAVAVHSTGHSEVMWMGSNLVLTQGHLRGGGLEEQSKTLPEVNTQWPEEFNCSRQALETRTHNVTAREWRRG